MNDNQPNSDTLPTQRPPWNKGKLIGAKPPLRPAHLWAIRTGLQLEGRVRDLAMFNLAIDSKLRGCDLVAIRVDDIAPNCYAPDRATVRQKKTGRPVQLRSLSRRGRQLMRISRRPVANWDRTYFRGEAMHSNISLPVNTRGSSANGSRASVLIPSSMARTRFAGRKPL